MTVIDSSAFVLYLLKEEGHLAVRSWLNTDNSLYSVSMLLAETGNILWKYHRTGMIAPERATVLYKKVVEICSHNIIIIEPNEQYGCYALSLAMEHNHSFYDMIFIAQAMSRETDLITIDKRQAVIAEKCGVNVVRL